MNSFLTLRSLSLLCIFAGTCAIAGASGAATASAAPGAGEVVVAAEQRLDIFEYRIEGVHTLSALEVEDAVYPWLGEARSPDDVEGARAALERAYHDKGYQTVAVMVPPQRVLDGVVAMQVVEGTVGRLRVRGARYFDLDYIKEKAPSIAEGKVPDFNQVTGDLVALNQLAELRVTPSLRAGVVPGTVDIDLNVEDELPLHGSLELNNRYSSNTKPLRINGSVSYSNLWQLGHTIGMSFQLAPQRIKDAEVYSAYYMMPIPGTPVKLLVQGIKQNSDISTLGSTNVVGKGDIVGAQAIVMLEGTDNYFHNLTLGIDYKDLDENMYTGGAPSTNDITYFPIALAYSGTLVDTGVVTQFNLGVNFHLRGMGSDYDTFSQKRWGSDGSYIYLTLDASQTRELGDDWQLFGRLQAQLSSQPLIPSEQFSVGGLSTVRGYLESEAMGDDGAAATLELRLPAFTLGGAVDELRPYVFTDWATVAVRNALKGQESHFNLGSFGAGVNLKLWKHLNGTLDIGVPVLKEGETDRFDPRLTFRIWAEF